jgi:hypothetical protein
LCVTKLVQMPLISKRTAHCRNIAKLPRGIAKNPAPANNVAVHVNASTDDAKCMWNCTGTVFPFSLAHFSSFYSPSISPCFQRHQRPQEEGREFQEGIIFLLLLLLLLPPLPSLSLPPSLFSNSILTPFPLSVNCRCPTQRRQRR